MPERRPEQPPPVVVALVLADEVRRDPASGKYAILGTFDAIRARHFPCQHPSVAAYLKATGGRGAVPITLRLVDVDETRPPVFTFACTLPFADPTQAVESALAFYSPLFPEPGDYRLQCLAGGELLRELRLRVRPVEDVDR